MDEIHAPVKETAVVGDLGFDVLRSLPALANLAHLQLTQALDIARLQDLIDTTALVTHVGHVNNRPLAPWDKG
jgi:hypothetical protein